MKHKIFALVFVLALLLAGCNSISEEEAIQITQDFVNKEVKFFVNEEDNNTVVQKAKISITSVEKIKDIWKVDLFVSSNDTGELKKQEVVINIDAKTGEVMSMGTPK